MTFLPKKTHNIALSSEDDEVPSSIQPQIKPRVSSEDTRQKNKSKKLTGQLKKPSNNFRK